MAAKRKPAKTAKRPPGKPVAKRSAPAAKTTTTTKKKTAPAKAAKRPLATRTAKPPVAKKAASSGKKKAAPAAKTRTKTKAASAAPTVGKKGASMEATRRRRASSRPVDDEAPTVEIPAPRAGRSQETHELEPISSAVPTARPSQRVLAAVAETPEERALTSEEEDAMTKVAETARRVIEATGEPAAIVATIATFLEDVRLGRRDEPKSQDVRLGLGVLWGEQLRAQVGWTWVHLTYPDGFASYALVPEDRAFACFPLNRVPEALRGAGANTSAHVFESIREGALPTRKARTYLVIG